MRPVNSGRAPFTYDGATYETYYKVFGDLRAPHAAPPILVAHGGPGMTHDYLLPHADLAAAGAHPRVVVFYDQIGNGRSSRRPDAPKAFWTVDLFLDELESLLAHLGVADEFDMVGHSWGGMMASELVVRRHPKGLRRLVIADSPASVALWGQSFMQLLGEFPEEVQETVKAGEEKDLKAYREAVFKVYAVYGLRIQPFPQEFLTTLEYRYGDDADRTVPNAGILSGWTVIDRLKDVDVPTLVINGAFDIAQDWVVEAYHKNIPGAKWVKFENSSHLPCWEEREEYMKTIASFLEA
ncbi:proline-specific peptidase [Epithele typhae]|uniref:proline-specific peptidase n=1 Tax=Epithele typhae TaxID=378194 RepID=UPI0020077D8A|nr:proline-specific peptidase [Epithele typhae]KAH9945108.1 proline-specific peptidase [Epithele typhae]